LLDPGMDYFGELHCTYVLYLLQHVG